MSADEGIRSGTPRHTDRKPQPPQPTVLEPTDAGTRVVETRHAENGVKPAANLNAYLSRIKTAAES
jgi:hypothetical protein